jgi:hypothetical protein
MKALGTPLGFLTMRKIKEMSGYLLPKFGRCFLDFRWLQMGCFSLFLVKTCRKLASKLMLAGNATQTPNIFKQFLLVNTKYLQTIYVSENQNF